MMCIPLVNNTLILKWSDEMLKRIYICILMLLVCLMLTACKLENHHPQSTTNAFAPTTESTISASEENTRSKKTQLQFYCGSNETVMNATLFSNDEYSIYIFDDDWNHKTDIINECSVDMWQNTADETAKLLILKMDVNDLQTAQSWVRDTFSKFELLEDNRGGLGGVNADGRMIDAQFTLVDGKAYILIKMYTLVDAETYGVFLNVMADTFEVY